MKSDRLPGCNAYRMVKPGAALREVPCARAPGVPDQTIKGDERWSAARSAEGNGRTACQDMR